LRLKRAEQGNLGDYKALKDKVFEMKVDYGRGYRIDFSKKGDTVILLLVGGEIIYLYASEITCFV